MTVYTLLSSAVVLLAAALVAAAWYTEVLGPTVIYCKTYLFEGRSQAEEKALDMMGESKLSYGLKDQLKRNKIIDNKEFGTAQDALADAVGGQLGKGGLGQEVGRGLSKGL